MKKIQWFDAHAHIQFAAFDEDREAVVERAVDKSVGIITVGTQRETSLAGAELAKKTETIWTTVGLHPIHSHESFYDVQEIRNEEKNSHSMEEIFDYEFYKELASDPKVVAIGECGLDYFHTKDQAHKGKQKQSFLDQMKLAKEVSKPLMIHCRDAFPDLIKIFEEYKESLNFKNPGVFHFFSGTEEDARIFLDLGFSFTFGGVITFPSKKNGQNEYEELVKYIPLDRILSETDAPYVAPVPHRGKRNEPVYVIEVVKKLAEIKNVSLEEVREQILENAKRVFQIEIT